MQLQRGSFMCGYYLRVSHWRCGPLPADVLVGSFACLCVADRVLLHRAKEASPISIGRIASKKRYLSQQAGRREGFALPAVQ